jgi:hypothetical protein
MAKSPIKPCTDSHPPKHTTHCHTINNDIYMGRIIAGRVTVHPQLINSQEDSIYYMNNITVGENISQI